jgi:hypothetical protein
MPSALLFGVDMPVDMREQDLVSIDLLKVLLIQDNEESSFDESQQPICELCPDPEPVPAPVLEEHLPAERAEEEQIQSDSDSDDESDIKPSITTKNIPWYTEMEYCWNDINGLWCFKNEMGEEMSEDDVLVDA